MFWVQEIWKQVILAPPWAIPGPTFLREAAEQRYSKKKMSTVVSMQTGACNLEAYFIFFETLSGL